MSFESKMSKFISHLGEVLAWEYLGDIMADAFGLEAANRLYSSGLINRQVDENEEDFSIDGLKEFFLSISILKKDFIEKMMISSFGEVETQLLLELNK